MPEKPETPTLDRLTEKKPCEGRILDHSQLVGQFIDWLQDEKHYVIAEWHTQESPFKGGDVSDLHSVMRSPSDLLHEFFEVDANAEEREKRALLDYVREMNAA